MPRKKSGGSGRTCSRCGYTKNPSGYCPTCYQLKKASSSSCTATTGQRCSKCGHTKNPSGYCPTCYQLKKASSSSCTATRALATATTGQICSKCGHTKNPSGYCPTCYQLKKTSSSSCIATCMTAVATATTGQTCSTCGHTKNLSGYCPTCYQIKKQDERPITSTATNSFVSLIDGGLLGVHDESGYYEREKMVHGASVTSPTRSTEEYSTTPRRRADESGYISDTDGDSLAPSREMTASPVRKTAPTSAITLRASSSPVLSMTTQVPHFLVSSPVSMTKSTQVPHFLVDSGLQIESTTLKSALPTTSNSAATPKATTSTVHQATVINPQTTPSPEKQATSLTVKQASAWDIDSELSPTTTASPEEQATSPTVKQGQASAGDLDSELVPTTTASPAKSPTVKQNQASAGDLDSELVPNTLASTPPTVSPAITLTLLSEQSGDWNYFSKRMIQTMPKATIQEIYKIYNEGLIERYKFARKRMLCKNSGNLNEMILFHGTSNVSPSKIINSEFGFDFRYCTKGLWGVGTYFAMDASYSSSYSYKPPGQGQKEMLAAWVLTGESYRCEPDEKLRRPPAKSVDGEEYYDTVCGHVGGSDVYVVYDHEKAYPRYLIRYTTD